MKILIVLSRIPYPLDKGDKLRAFHQIKELSKKNDIYLFCLNNSNIDTKSKDTLLSFVKEIFIADFNSMDSFKGLFSCLFNKIPFQTGYYTHKKNINLFKLYCERIKPDVLYNQFVRTANYIHPNFPKVLDFQDALSLNMEGRAKKSIFVKKLFFLNEAKRLRKYEAKMFEVFDALTIIVEADKRAINSNRQDEIKVLPNGVDESYFNYNFLQDKKEYDIIFSGRMSYSPNIDAANYLIKHIMPLVWDKLPYARVVIAGANPSPLVKKLTSEKTIITGWVDDMREYYAKSKIFIAPMQIGTGLQNKLLEAMAMGLPCITTPLANNALRAIPNKDIIIANSRIESAKAIIRLLKDREFSQNIAKNGNIFVKENYSWEKYGVLLEDILTNTIKPLQQ